jgi:hypothetical protein
VKEFCFAVKGATEISSLFSDDDRVIMIEPTAMMADILVMAEIYPSKSRAKKDGWDKPIPLGWSEQEIGKLKTKIYIWNPRRQDEIYQNSHRIESAGRE